MNIERITKDKKCKILELEKNFPQYFIDFSVNRQLNNNVFTEIFTISDNTQIIGFIIIDIIYERMELIQFEVKRQYQNQGYGKKLLEFIIDLAEKKQLENITLEVNIKNNIAINIYEKYGFKKIAERKKYYHGIDGILMERKMI